MATLDQPATPRLLRKWLPVPILVALVWFLFLRTLNYEFIEYGEASQLLSNPAMRELDMPRIVELLTQPTLGRYCPPRAVSYALDYKLWKSNASGYHLTNVLLHTANVLLLYALSVRLVRIGRVGPAPMQKGRGAPSESVPNLAGLICAALFAVHPVVVEPVTWIGARESLLMMLFGLLCLHAHLAASDPRRSVGRQWMWHLVAGFCGLFACLSSVLATVLPVVIVLYDLTIGRKRRPLRWGRILGGSILLWLAAALAIYMKIRADQSAAQANIRPMPEWLPVMSQIYTVFYTYWYNVKTLLVLSPTAIIYPNVIADRLLIKGVLAGIVLSLALLVLIWAARRKPLIQFALLWFAAAILPACHLVPHVIYRADRFLYLPLAGLSLTLGAAVAVLCERRQRAIVPVSIAALTVVFIFGVAAWRHTPIWRTTLSVFQQCAGVNPLEPAVHNNLGAALLQDNQIERANKHFEKALRLQSQGAVSIIAQINLGYAYLRLGDLDRAIQRFNTALQINPNDARAYNGRASAYARRREPGHRRALIDLARAIELQPDYADAYFNRGNIYSDLGRYEDAITDYTRLITLNPGHAQAYHMRGTAEAGLRRLQVALIDLNTAASLGLDDPALYLHRGMVRTELGNYEDAVADFTTALEMRPRYTEAMIKRGILYYTNLNQSDRAVEDFSRAIALQPDAAEAHLYRGLVWLEGRDYDRAMLDLTQSIRLRADDPRAYYHRGLVYAQRNEPDRARRDWQRTVLLAPNSELARSALQNMAELPTTTTQAG